MAWIFPELAKIFPTNKLPCIPKFPVILLLAPDTDRLPAILALPALKLPVTFAEPVMLALPTVIFVTLKEPLEIRLVFAITFSAYKLPDPLPKYALPNNVRLSIFAILAGKSIYNVCKRFDSNGV